MGSVGAPALGSGASQSENRPAIRRIFGATGRNFSRGIGFLRELPQRVKAVENSSRSNYFGGRPSGRRCVPTRQRWLGGTAGFYYTACDSVWRGATSRPLLPMLVMSSRVDLARSSEKRSQKNRTTEKCEEYPSCCINRPRSLRAAFRAENRFAAHLVPAFAAGGHRHLVRSYD